MAKKRKQSTCEVVFTDGSSVEFTASTYRQENHFIHFFYSGQRIADVATSAVRMIWGPYMKEAKDGGSN